MDENSFGGLPVEVLLRIFEFLGEETEFPEQELLRCMQVCSQWRIAANHSHLWKSLTCHRWVHGLPSNEQDIIDWKEVFRQRYLLDRKIVRLLKDMSSGIRSAELDASHALIDSGLLAYDKVNQIANILPQANPSFYHQHLNLVYNARKIFREINERLCMEEWEKLLSTSDDIPLETGSALLAKWEYPEITAEWVAERVQALADGVKAKLGGNFSEFSSTEVLHAMLEYLFQDLNFAGNLHNYYDPKNSFINEVLESKTGIPISLSVVVHSVGRRLGLDLKPIGFPTHFLLGFTSPEGKILYIDSFNKGRILSRNQCMDILAVNAPGLHHVTEASLEPIPSKLVFTRMISNLMNIYSDAGDFSKFAGILEMLRYLRPLSVEEWLVKLRVMTMIPHKNREVRELIEKALQEGRSNFIGLPTEALQVLHRSAEQHADREILVKSRKDPRYSDINFKIGTIMNHKVLGYRGVIYGYDDECVMSEDWKQRMGTNELQFGSEQPFYNVLVDRGHSTSSTHTTYVAQENIELTTDLQPIDHAEVGKYFESFDGTRYVPHEGLLRSYPEL